jgi:hypothetical protein
MAMEYGRDRRESLILENGLIQKLMVMECMCGVMVST